MREFEHGREAGITLSGVWRLTSLALKERPRERANRFCTKQVGRMLLHQTAAALQQIIYPASLLGLNTAAPPQRC